MWFLLLILNSALAATPEPENPFRVLDRAPAIDGPATEIPVGENSSLYEFLEEVERDTNAYDYNVNARPTLDEIAPIQLSEMVGPPKKQSP